MMAKTWWGALCAGLLLCGTARAEEVVFYRCTDAAGTLTVQNQPCPRGSTEKKQVVQGVGTAQLPFATPARPAPAAPAAMPAPSAATAPSAERAEMLLIGDGATPVAPAAPSPPPSDTTPLPAPVLFECTTYDQGSYITEDAEPKSRCMALQTVGLDGNPRNGAGQACEMVRDTCARVPDQRLCAAWRKRLGETEVAWRFGRAENETANKAEFERVQRIVAGTVCATR